MSVNTDSTVITDEGCQFKGNRATSKGSQIFNSDSTLTLTCFPGQYNGFEKSGQVVLNFTGCGNLCPKGKYANGIASRDLSGCISCPLTKTCPRDGTGSPVPSPAGRFGAEEGLTSLKCSGTCDPGHYCPVGATNSTFRSCPAGRFVSVPGSSSVSNCSTCKASFYCEEAALFERPCPSGTYGNETALSQVGALETVSRLLLSYSDKSTPTLSTRNIQYVGQCYMHWVSCWIPRHQSISRCDNVGRNLRRFESQHGVLSVLLELQSMMVKPTVNCVHRGIFKTSPHQVHANALQVELPMAMVQQVLKFVVVEHS